MSSPDQKEQPIYHHDQIMSYAPLSLGSLVPFKFVSKKLKSNRQRSSLTLSGGDMVKSSTSLDHKSEPDEPIFLLSQETPKFPSNPNIDMSCQPEKQPLITGSTTYLSQITCNSQQSTTQERQQHQLSPKPKTISLKADRHGITTPVSENNIAALDQSDARSFDGTSDTAITNNKFNAAMARLAAASSGYTPSLDAFDSLQWDPDLPSSNSADDSPHPVTVQPQYTTVGSRINHNAQTQITAPNRLHREPAIRRSAMPSSSSRMYDGAAASRAPQLSLNMQTSMQYTQQLAMPTMRPSNSPPPQSSLSSHSTLSATQVTEQGSDILTRLSSFLSITPAQSPGPPEHLESVAKLPSSTTPTHKHGIINGLPSMKAGEQRLEKFRILAGQDNPLQATARHLLPWIGRDENKLDATLNKIKIDCIANKVGLNTMLLRRQETLKQQELVARTQGSAEQQLQFGSFVMNPDQQPVRENITHKTDLLRGAATTYRAPQGYPQPLSAGPPGQRFSNMLPGQAIASGTQDSRLEPQVFGAFHAPSNYHDNEQLLKHRRYQAQLLQSSFDFQQPASSVKVRDTLPFDAVSKYYPHGKPNNMTGIWKPLSAEVQREMDEASKPDGTADAAYQQHMREVEINKQFYSGQRSYGMLIHEYENEWEMKNKEALDGVAAGAKPRVRYSVEKLPITKQEMEAMNLSDATEPLIHGVFGTLLAYTDDRLDNRRALSGWVESPAHLIDDTVEGRKTFFGGSARTGVIGQGFPQFSEAHKARGGGTGASIDKNIEKIADAPSNRYPRNATSAQVWGDDRVSRGNDFGLQKAAARLTLSDEAGHGELPSNFAVDQLVVDDDHWEV